MAAPVMIEGCEYANTTDNESGMVAVPMSIKELQALITDIMDTAREVPWGRAVGFAAPQIGRPLRVFVALGQVFINPVITWFSPKIVLQSEGCYSLEDNRLNYTTPRHHSVEVVWQALLTADDGTVTVKTKRQRFHRYDAQVIQHEYDHINGVLCCEPKKDQIEEAVQVN